MGEIFKLFRWSECHCLRTKPQNFEINQNLLEIEFLLFDFRLSEHVALKLADNNPNIADLSDMNRPTLLAEKFSTLYDDQWTDAFDALSGQPGFEQESKAIQFLLEVVQVQHFL